MPGTRRCIAPSMHAHRPRQAPEMHMAPKCTCPAHGHGAPVPKIHVDRGHRPCACQACANSNSNSNAKTFSIIPAVILSRHLLRWGWLNGQTSSAFTPAEVALSQFLERTSTFLSPPIHLLNAALIRRHLMPILLVKSGAPIRFAPHATPRYLFCFRIPRSSEPRAFHL
jgi:hypothetical protein